MEAASKELGHELTFIETRLSKETAALAKGHPAVCIFVNDIADKEALQQELKASGAGLLALRCAGFNNVDLEAAREFGLTSCVFRPIRLTPWRNTPLARCWR